MNRDRSPLKRNSSELNNLEMATNTLSHGDIQIRFNFAKCMVPKYFGGSKDLNYFLVNAKEFLDKFTFTDAELTSYFFKYVISQIEGEARDVVTLHNPKNFGELKIILLNKYKDPCSEENLLTLLTTSYQNQNQSFEEFALEINKNLHKLKENAQIEYSDQLAFLQLKFNDFEKQALYSFISGLKEPYCSFVRQQKPTKIDECINICREYDNIQAQINYKNFLRHNMSKKNIFKTNSHFSHNNSNRNHSSFENSNSFPRGPVNLPPRKPHQQHFPTNIQAFSSPRNNVFKPQNNNNNLPRPTPMSVTSRNTLRSNFNNGRFPQNQSNYNQNFNNNRNFSNNQNRNNHFARQGPAHPNVIVEEIHNTEANISEESHENFPLETPFQDST